MDVRRCTLPAQVYPRYMYTRKHCMRLFVRFSQLLTQCDLTDPYVTPAFDDVHIYTVQAGPDNVVSVADVLLKDKNVNARFEPLSLGDVVEDIKSNKASIVIASYSQTQTYVQLLELPADYILIVDQASNVDTYELKTGDAIILHVKRNTLADEISRLLERMILRELRPRLKLLDTFVNIDTATVFSSLDHDIKSALQQSPGRLIRSMSDGFVSTYSTPGESLNEDLMAYFGKRLEIVENKINFCYGRDFNTIREQLLQNNQPPPLVTPLAVCDVLQGRIIAGDSREVSSIQITNTMQKDVRLFFECMHIYNKTQAIETRCRRHIESLGKCRSSVETLRGDIIGMFKRSKVPEHERQSLDLKPWPILTKEFAKKILSVSGVTGCGYRYTTLDVYFSKELSQNERSQSEDEIEAVLHNDGVLNYECRTEEEHMTKYVEVGSEVTSIQGRNASLGGFVCDENGDLCILIAQHFASLGRDVYMQLPGHGKRKMAEVLTPRQNIECPLDIAVAKVEPRISCECNPKFRNSNGDYLNSYLIEFQENDLENLQGLPVHTWGAASRPGEGKILHPDFYVPGMKRLVKIQDVDAPVVRFAKAGDSGAIICADDPDDDHVKVISMLMGSPIDDIPEDKPKEYITLRLNEGMLQLTEEHQTNFTLC